MNSDQLKPTMAFIWRESDQLCHPLSGSVEDNAMTFSYDEKDNLVAKFKGSDDGSSLMLTIDCNKDTLFGSEQVNTGAPASVGSFESSAGCRDGELSTIWTWFEDNKWLVFVIFVLIGLAVTFFGRAFFKPVLFLTGVFEASFLIMLLCYSTFTSERAEIWVGWVILVVSVAIGIAIGFVFIRFPSLGGFCLAAWGGFSFGLLIYNAFLYKVNSDIALWTFTVAMGLLYGSLILYFFDHVLIHATSMIGSFLCVFGIGLVAGRYTNPFTIAQLIKHGQLSEVDPVFYAYLGGNIVLYAIGCVWQYAQLRKAKAIQKALKGSTVSMASGTKLNESNTQGKE